MSTGVGMSSCCLSGFIAEGSPSGMEKEIAGTMTYVAEPENGSTKQTVIFLPDSTFHIHSGPSSLPRQR